MGLAIDRDRFDPVNYHRFEERLEECLLALFLIDGRARALPRNQEVRADAADPRVVLEIDRFNLELNLTPAPLAGRPFSAFGAEVDEALAVVRRAAAAHGGRVVMTGILPTLRPGDLGLAALSDARRFRALNNGIRRLRQEPSRVRIDGADPLELAVDDVVLEGANTSFQVHLRVDPERFAAVYNAVQLATGPVLAVAGNSPTFLGHRLWEETRVALFKQVVDDRDAAGRASRRVCRMAFGTGWVQEGAAELLEQSARRSRWRPTPAPGPVGCRSSRSTTTSTAPPSSARARRWRGRSTRAGGSARCPWPSWPAGCSPPPGRASSRPVSPARRSTGCWA
jgi:hypothetical protein